MAAVTLEQIVQPLEHISADARRVCHPPVLPAAAAGGALEPAPVLPAPVAGPVASPVASPGTSPVPAPVPVAAATPPREEMASSAPAAAATGLPLVYLVLARVRAARGWSPLTVFRHVAAGATVTPASLAAGAAKLGWALEESAAAAAVPGAPVSFPAFKDALERAAATATAAPADPAAADPAAAAALEAAVAAILAHPAP